MKSRALLLAMFAAAPLLVGCSDEAATPVPSPETRQVAVNVLAVTPTSLPRHHTATGSVVSDHRLMTASRVMGYIKAIHVQEGDFVAKGDLLVSIDPADIEAGIAQAKAGLEQAQANQRKATSALVDATADYERFKGMYEQNSVPKRDFEKMRLRYQVAQQDVQAAEAGVRQAQAGLTNARDQLKYAAITAPARGVVTQKLKSSGDIATPGFPILVIESPDQLIFRTQAREQQVGHIAIGDAVELSIDALGHPIPGKVSQVVPSGDPATHTYLVKVALAPSAEDARALKAGMFGRATFTLGSEDGMVIPPACIVEKGGLSGVYRIDEQGKLAFQMVRLGRIFTLQGTPMQEIVAGLEAGDRIVVDATLTLRTGMTAVVAPAPAAPAPQGGE